MATIPRVEPQDLASSPKKPSQSVGFLETASPKANADASSIAPSLAHTHVAGGITELRALNGNLVQSGHYTDLGLLFQYAIELNRQGYATYACINPLRPECAKELNGPPRPGKTAKDKHIAELRYLVYDIDPMRKDAEGKRLEVEVIKDGNKVIGKDGKVKKRALKCASTDGEKELARTVATRVYDFYFEMGVAPVLIDSGNGFYVLVPVSLKREEKYLTRALLAQHAAEFDIKGGAEIDESAANPSHSAYPRHQKLQGKRDPGTTTQNVSSPDTR